MRTFTLKEAPLTKKGFAFYDHVGNEWEPMELYNRCTATRVYLPWTTEVNNDPNISVNRHEGRRVIDNHTFNYYLRRYSINHKQTA